MVGDGLGDGVGPEVVGDGVGDGLGSEVVGEGVGDGVGSEAVGDRVGLEVVGAGAGVGLGVGVGVGENVPSQGPSELIVSVYSPERSDQPSTSSVYSPGPSGVTRIVRVPQLCRCESGINFNGDAK